ncbi:MAG: restriction endonuclease subunit S [Nanoarchaeota archaeon]
MITTIEKLFNVDYGQGEYETKENLDEGKTILIASGGEDNGIYGFMDIKPFYKAPVISVPRTGTIGQAFVQEVNCCISSDSLVLIPKEKISLEHLYQIAFQIRKLKWKFCYGRKITPDRLKKEKIKLEKSNKSYISYKKGLMPKKNKAILIRENKKIKIVNLTELCNIERKSALPQNAMDLDGKVPYVTTTSKNNGVSEFVSEEPNSKGKCLSIALNGSVGQVFFQFDDFITSGDNAVLTLKSKYNPYLLFYIGFQIYRQRWAFNYCRKLSEGRLMKFNIPLPLNDKGGYDLEYIEKLVKNCYGFKKLKKYI